MSIIIKNILLKIKKKTQDQHLHSLFWTDHCNSLPQNGIREENTLTASDIFYKTCTNSFHVNQGTPQFTYKYRLIPYTIYTFFFINL